MMKLPNFLQKLSPLGVATLGAIAATGMAIAPAQADDLMGELPWLNGTSDFVDSATDSFDMVGDTFEVNFSPTFGSLTGVAPVQAPTFDFVPPFTPVPDFYPINGNAGTGNITFENILLVAPAPGVTAEAEFKNNDLISFNFGNGVTAELAAGSTFLGELKNDDAVEFELITGEWEFTFDATTPTPGMAEAFSSTFLFGQAAGTETGTYEAEGIIGVPEPGSILGLLAVGGLGLGMKRKKQQ